MFLAYLTGAHSTANLPLRISILSVHPIWFQKGVGENCGEKKHAMASKNAWTGRPPAQQMLCRPADGGVLLGRMLTCSYTPSLHLLVAVYQWYWAGWTLI